MTFLFRMEQMHQKPCIACHLALPIAEFYIHPKMADGHLNKCKTCCKVAAKKLREDKLNEVRERDRNRYRRDYEKRRTYASAYQRTDKGKKAAAASRRRYADRNPERRAARIALGNAVRDGRIIKPGACQECGAPGRIHGHHDDYSRPLAVRWLCVPCHTLAHYGERAVVRSIHACRETRT